MVVNGDQRRGWTKFLLQLSLYGACFAVAARHGFGLPCFIILLIIAIFVNGLGERRWAHEISAYSVFNRDFRSIPGSTTDLDAQWTGGAVQRSLDAEGESQKVHSEESFRLGGLREEGHIPTRDRARIAAEKRAAESRSL